MNCILSSCRIFHCIKIPIAFASLLCAYEPAFSQDCDGLPATRLDIHVTGRIPEILGLLSRLYRIQINVEEDFSYYSKPGLPQNLCDGVGHGTINEKRITLCEALQILTKHVDSRYTWRAWKGKVVNVFPWRLQFDPDYIMNQHIGDIRIRSKNIYEVFNIVNEKLSENNQYLPLYKPDSTIYSGSPDLFLYCEDQRKKIERSLQSTLSLHISGSIREILNKAVLSLGRGFIWTLESRHTMGGKEIDFCMSESYLLQTIKIFDYTADCYWNIYLPKPTSKMNCSLRPLPHDIVDRNLFCEKWERKRIEINGVPMESAVLILSLKFNIPVHFESVLWNLKENIKQHTHMHDITLNGAYTIAEALEAVTTQDARYTWRWWECRAINVYPKYDGYDPYYIMNLSVKNLELSGSTIADGLKKISEIVRDRYRVITVDMNHGENTKGSSFAYNLPAKSFSISFNGVALRQVLNTLFDIFDERISWQYRRWTVLTGVEDRERWWCGMEAHSELIPVPPGEE